MNCNDVTTVVGCRKDATGAVLGNVLIHTEYRRNATGGLVVHAVRYTDAASATPIALVPGETVTPDSCDGGVYIGERGCLVSNGAPGVSTPVQILRELTPNGDIANTRLLNGAGDLLAYDPLVDSLRIGDCVQPLPEFDRIVHGPSAVCANGVPYLIRTVEVIDNLDGSSAGTTVEYSTDGSAWSTVVPPGPIVVGACTETDAVYSSSTLMKAVNAGVTSYWFTRQRMTVRNTDGAILVTVTEWSQDGTGWVTVAPAGAISPVVAEGRAVAVDTVCVENPVGTFAQQFVRYAVVNGVATTEFSANGTTWTTAVPAGTVRPGSCAEVDVVFASPMPVCVENPAGTFTPWFYRSRNPVNNAAGVLGAEVREYSSDGVTWVTVAPTGTVRAGDCVSPLNAGTAGGAQGTNVQVLTIPATAYSFTVTAQVGSFDVSFDGGATYPLTGRQGSRTWGGVNDSLTNAANIRVRGGAAGSVFDVIYRAAP